MISTALATAGGSSEWFVGALVAYASSVKHAVLDVPDGPVVTRDRGERDGPRRARAARRGRRRGRDRAGGSGGQDGREPGTVFVAVDRGGDQHRITRLDLDDEPEVVCATATVAALRMLAEALETREPLDRA